MSKDPKYRRQLNPGQITVLELLLKFRFVTTELIAKSSHKSNGTAIKSRLNILREQGYIDRRYESADRLTGKHAAYYITPKGVRALKREDEQTIIKRVYRDATTSRQFIDHNLAVFNMYSHFTEVYGNHLKFFTKSDLVAYDYFPHPMPDAFISCKGDTQTKRFFLEYFESSTPSFAHNKRIKQLIDYYEAGEWDATNSDFPTILIVCDTPTLRNRIEKRVLYSLQDADTDDVIFALSNSLALSGLDDRIWCIAGEDELMTLVQL